MHKTPLIILIVLLMLACNIARPSPTATAFIAPTALPATTQPPAATDAPAPAVVTPTSQSRQQFIAYIYTGQLLVTDVTGGSIGGTTQYTTQGQSDQVSDLVWSPSGEYVAFVAAPNGDAHLFYIYAEGARTPTDLGPGSAPAWSPDSKSIAYIGGKYPDENIYMTTIDNPAPQQLTFETNHAWGRPAFTPDGQSLIVSTADRNDMGAQGNTTYTLQKLALNAAGTLVALPGATPMEGVRLPYDLRTSPDGTRFAFSTSAHYSACASPGGYYVSDFNGTRQELVSLSLRSANDPSLQHYLVGFSYGWSPASDAIVASGTVVDCDPNSATMGKAIAGPQMSILKLDGSEGLIIPGTFWSPSMDRTGTMIAAAHYQDNQDTNPMVEIYSVQNGQLLTKVGPGNSPQMQP